MEKYAESKAKIDKIREELGEVIFRMSVSHLMDVGIRHLTEENIEATCEEMVKEDDSWHFMSNSVKCEIVRGAGRLAKIDHIHLLCYIADNVEYSVDSTRRPKLDAKSVAYTAALMAQELTEESPAWRHLFVEDFDRIATLATEFEAKSSGVDYEDRMFLEEAMDFESEVANFLRQNW